MKPGIWSSWEMGGLTGLSISPPAGPGGVSPLVRGFHSSTVGTLRDGLRAFASRLRDLKGGSERDSAMDSTLVAR